ncbi:hypothetical protein E4U21_005954 [Claviceps maximensis]|nr:hypothetical protein E4U21_005954 [Claviceps maximensis]
MGCAPTSQDIWSKPVPSSGYERKLKLRRGKKYARRMYETFNVAGGHNNGRGFSRLQPIAVACLY